MDSAAVAVASPERRAVSAFGAGHLLNGDGFGVGARHLLDNDGFNFYALLFTNFVRIVLSQD